MKDFFSFLENVDAAQKEKTQRAAAHAKMKQDAVRTAEAGRKAGSDALARQEAENRSRRKEAFKNRLRKKGVRFTDAEVD